MDEYRLIDIHFLSRRYETRAKQFKICSDEVNALNVEYIPRYAFEEMTEIPNYGSLEDACRLVLKDRARWVVGCLFVGVLVAADPRPIACALHRAVKDKHLQDVFHTLSLKKVN